MSNVNNSRALTGEKPCINNAFHALLMHGYATFNILVPVKRRNKIVQEITRNVANVFNFYAIIAIEHGFFNALTFAKSLGRC